MAGLTQTIMLSLSMVVIAALVGADGLGVPVVRALNTVNTALGFEAGLVIVVVAIVLDRTFREEAEPMTAMIEFDNVSIVFGSSPDAALPLMDEGQTRERDPEGHRPGPRRARLLADRRRGRDLGADGPVGLGQVDAAAGGQRAEPGRARQMLVRGAERRRWSTS